MPAAIQMSVEATGFQSSLEKQAMAAAPKVAAIMGKGLNSRAFNEGFSSMNANVRQFEKSLDFANRRVIAFGTSATLIYGSVRAFKELVTASIQVEKSLASINSIFGLTGRQLDKFGRDLFNVARDTAQSFEQVAKAAEEFSRQGLGAAETAKRTRDAMLLVRLTGLDTVRAVETLTAAMNTFGKVGIDTTQIVNRLTAVDQAFAVSARDIAEAFQRVGSVAEDAGVSIDQFAGLVTAAKQITSRDGAVIGNSLKTIFTRLERSSTLDQLESMGVAVRDVTGAALPALEVFDRLAKSYRTLGREQQQQVAELGAGVFQINQFKALLSDLGKANGVAAQATKISMNATNEALIRNAALNKTLDASIQNLKASATEAASVVGNLAIKPMLLQGLEVGNIFLNIVNKAKSPETVNSMADAGAALGEGILRGIGNTLAGPGLIILGRVIFGAVKRLVPQLKGEIGMGLLPAVSGREAQMDIASIIDKGTAAEQRRFAAARNVAEQEAAILAILQRQSAVYASLLEAGYGKAAAVAGATAATRGAATTKSGRIRGAAEGYLPAMAAERAAVTMGVGGAPSSARPVVLSNFNFGGGKTGPLVANTSEYIVPNMAGGGSGIFNQDMIRKHGLPPGATPVAAGGYVPNMADGGSPFDKFPMQLGSQYGLKMPERDIRAMGEMFDKLSKAASVTEGANFGPQLTDMAMSLDKISQKGVLAAVGAQFARLSRLPVRTQVIEPMMPDTAPSALSPTQSRVFDNSGVVTANLSLRDVEAARRERQVVDAERSAARRGVNEIEYGVSMKRQDAAREMRRNRMANRVQMGLVAGSLASGFVPEGTSGKASGMASGAISGGLQGASLGGFAGALAGPTGVIAGSIIGGLAGAISGFISRFSKSLDELAQEIEESNNRSAQTLQDATQFVGFQQNIAEALEKGKGQDVINSLFRQQRSVAGGLPAGVMSKLLSAGFDPEKQSSVLADMQTAQTEKVSRGALTTRLRTLSKESTPEEISALASSLAGLVGEVGDLGATPLRGKLSNPDLANMDAASGGFQQILAGIQEQALLKMTGLVQRSGLDADTQSSVLGSLGKQDAETLVRTLEAVQGVGSNAPLFQNYVKTQQQVGVGRNQISDLIRKRESGLGLSAIYGGARNRMLGMREQASLGLGDLTEQASLRASGGFAIAAAQREASLNMGQAVGTAQNAFSRAGLKISASDGVKAQIAKAQSAEDFERILASSFKGQDAQDELQKVVDTLNETVAQNETMIALASEQNRIDQLQLQAQQQQRLLSAGTFNPSGAISLRGTFDRLRSTGGPALSGNRIALSEMLTNMGLPQTDEGAAFERSARMSSVGSQLDVIERTLGNSNRPEAQMIRGRLAEARKSLAFDPGAARKELLSGNVTPTTLQQLASSGQVGAGTLVLRDPLQKIEAYTKASADLLRDIVAEEKRMADIETRGSLIQESLNIDQRLLMGKPNITDVKRQESITGTIASLSAAIDNPDGYRTKLAEATSAAIVEGTKEAQIILQTEGATVTAKRPFALSGFGTGFFGQMEENVIGEFDSVEEALHRIDDVGKQVANSLQSNLGNAFGDFVTGAQSGKDAFRSFIVGVMNDSARAFASKAVMQLFGSMFGGFFASGGGVQMDTGGLFNTKAAGGSVVPTLLTGGEYVFSPSQAANIGPATLSALNSGRAKRFAWGGMVRGGSGVTDDVPMGLAAGSYVIKKSSTSQYGAGFLSNLAARASGGGVGGAALSIGSYDGGSSLSPVAMASGGPVMGGGGAASVNIGVTINDNRTTTNAEVSGGGSGMDRQFAENLAIRMRQIAIDEIANQTRTGGMLRRQSLRAT